MRIGSPVPGLGMYGRWLLVPWLLCQGVLLAGLPAIAESGDTAQEALREAARFPWYDAAADDVQRVRLRSEANPPKIGNWSWPERKKSNWNFNLGPFLGRALKVFAWLFLLVVLLVAVTMVIRAYLEGEMFGLRVSQLAVGENAGRSDAERIENLPFDVRVAQTDLLAEARRLREAGKFGEAVVYLFSYMLVQLDKQHLIRLTRGKTNRQYLREVSPRRDVRRVLQPTMVAFEDAFFGNHAIERVRFESLWNTLDDFHGMLGAEPFVRRS